MRAAALPSRSSCGRARSPPDQSGQGRAAPGVCRGAGEGGGFGVEPTLSVKPAVLTAASINAGLGRLAQQAFQVGVICCGERTDSAQLSTCPSLTFCQVLPSVPCARLCWVLMVMQLLHLGCENWPPHGLHRLKHLHVVGGHELCAVPRCNIVQPICDAVVPARQRQHLSTLAVLGSIACRTECAGQSLAAHGCRRCTLFTPAHPPSCSNEQVHSQVFRPVSVRQVISA